MSSIEIILEKELPTICIDIIKPAKDFVPNKEKVEKLLEDFIFVEGGTFIMGSPVKDEEREFSIFKSYSCSCFCPDIVEECSDEETRHKVTVDSFYMLSSAVTQELWEAVMGNNPSSQDIGSELPVTNVSWFDCMEFIKAINELTGKHYRLPTEVEWEYAAKGGNQSKGYIYSGSNHIKEVAWYNGNSERSLQPVKKLKANELGLYDMSGNVREWCEDLYRFDKYWIAKDREYFKLDNYRVLRGGAWNIESKSCCCAPSDCHYYEPSERHFYSGFRIVYSETENINKMSSNQKTIEQLLVTYGEILKQAKDFVPNQEKVEKLLEDFVFVEGGTFIMGSPETEEERSCTEVQCEVTVDSFYMQASAVTQELWEAVMGNNPSSEEKGGDLPVTDVNWFDCMEFIKAINELTGKNYRLPTEEEWEYAAKGGNKSKGYIYSGSNNIEEVAWYEENCDRLQPVKKLKPNELGLYDMSGNVDEWCESWYELYGLALRTLEDYKAPKYANERILRGGVWDYESSSCRSASHSGRKLNSRQNNIGFRIVCSKTDKR